MPTSLDPVIIEKTSGSVVGSTALTKAFGIPPVAGTLLVAIVGNTTVEIPAMVGSWQLARAVAFSIGGGATRVTLFYRIAGANEPSLVTVATPCACDMDLQAFQVGNIIGPVSVSLDTPTMASVNQSGGTITSLAVTAAAPLVQPSEIAFVVIGLDGTPGGTPSWTGGFTTGFAGNRTLSATLVTSATTAPTTTVTWTTARHATGLIVTFKGTQTTVANNDLSSCAIQIRLSTQADVDWWNARQIDGTLVPQDTAVLLSPDAALLPRLAGVGTDGFRQIQWRNWRSTSDGFGKDPSAQSMIPAIPVVPFVAAFDSAYYDPESALTYSGEYGALGGGAGSIKAAADNCRTLAAGGLLADGLDLWYGGDSASFDSTLVSAVTNATLSTVVIQGQFKQLQGNGNTNQNLLTGSGNFDDSIGNKILAARAAKPTIRVAVQLSLDVGDAASCYATLTHMKSGRTPTGTAYGIPDVICIYQTGDIPSGQADLLIDLIRPANVGNTLQLLSISRTSGSSLGGELVTFTGAGFKLGAIVTFGSAQATFVSLSSANTAVYRTPPHPPGFVDVVWTNPDTTQVTLFSAFQYASAPVVTSVTPSSGKSGGNETGFIINGSGFVNGTGLAVRFGTAVAPLVTWQSSIRLSVTTPAHVAGQVKVSVTNPDGSIGTSSSTVFTYIDGPHIDSLDPLFGDTLGGTYVTIHGSGFQLGATVTFGGVPAGGFST